MPLEPKDQALIADIQKAAAEVAMFIAGMKESAFYKDIKTQKAVERELEIIGEAARALSDEAKKNYPKVPFRSMIGMRNILAHDYGRVELKELWSTTHGSLPLLLIELKKRPK